MHPTQILGATITAPPQALASYQDQLLDLPLLDRPCTALGLIGGCLNAPAAMPIGDGPARAEIAEALAVYQAHKSLLDMTISQLIEQVYERESAVIEGFVNPPGVEGWALGTRGAR